MIIDFDYRQVEVPQEIIRYCDYSTYNVSHDDLRFLDCVYMNMGLYGNKPKDLKEMRHRVMSVFE